MPPRSRSTDVAGPVPARSRATGRDAVLAWLDGRINHERTRVAGGWGLGRMRRLLHLLSRPERDLPVVHVAGTKGKGSTVAMLTAMLQASGYRVGCYTSPHVHRVEERIAVNGRLVAAAPLTAAWKQVRRAVEQMDAEAARRGGRGPTWFEILTAMALLHFRQRQVDLAVLETGLGGRLDATNVCQPVLAVITSISLDHMAELGDSIASIAGEKAGIIKRGVPVLCGARDEAARRVIADTAARRRSPLVMVDRDFSLRIAAADGADAEQRHAVDVVPTSPRRLVLPEEMRGRGVCDVGMVGRHQAENAGLAIAAGAILHARGYPMRWERALKGLQGVHLPARIEQMGHHPRLFVDAAHNAASMRSLCETLPRQVGRGGARVFVFAASADKQLAEMLAATSDWADRLVLTRYTTNPRAASLESLVNVAERAVPDLGQTAVVEADPLAATRRAVALAGSNGIVCVAGSFFLAGEVRAMLLETTQGRC